MEQQIDYYEAINSAVYSRCISIKQTSLKRNEEENNNNNEIDAHMPVFQKLTPQI